jgi:hypothetical protein
LLINKNASKCLDILKPPENVDFQYFNPLPETSLTCANNLILSRTENQLLTLKSSEALF